VFSVPRATVRRPTLKPKNFVSTLIRTRDQRLKIVTFGPTYYALSYWIIGAYGKPNNLW